MLSVPLALNCTGIEKEYDGDIEALSRKGTNASSIRKGNTHNKDTPVLYSEYRDYTYCIQ